MKLFKIVGTFIIFYFVITVSGAVIQLAKTISGGNEYIEIGFYVMIGIILMIYVILPLIYYINRPSVKLIHRMALGEEKAIRQYRRYLRGSLGPKEKQALDNIQKDQVMEMQQWMIRHLRQSIESNRQVVKKTAIRLTATVMISPNSFIDGLAILIGNSHMIYEISKTIGVRFKWRDLIQMYFGTFTMASVTGIVQEFDEEIEELFEPLVEEFGEFLTEESGKSVSESIPVANILAKAMVPVFQAASNYAYVIYMGNRFLLTILNELEEEPQALEDLNRKIRKEARKEKYQYVANLTAQMGVNGKEMIKRKFFKGKKKEKS